MSETTIEWTDATWNPVTGCTKVSQGCKHCYAEGVAERVWGTQYPPRQLPDGSERPRRFTDVRCHPDRLAQPLRWRRPRRVFVNSMSDLFHEAVPDEFLNRVFGVMWLAARHTFQVLTKRPERARDYLSAVRYVTDPRADTVGAARLPERWPLPNVWVGTSVEDQATADERIPLLLQTAAAVRFLSCEPLLERVDVATWLWSMMSDDHRCALDWLIVGGESGPKARPMDLAWARDLVAQCRAAGVACFVKQLGARPFVVDPETGDEWPVSGLRDRKGGDPSEWPYDLRVREWPDRARKGTP